ncbi:MAG: hypothetical protein KGI51_08430 [Rhodospirillales bacterium]|nr:hypothetical protein [Rhodospirillales bacterium]
MSEPASPLAFTIHDTTRVSGVSRTGIYEAVGRGDLVAVKAGRRTLILAVSLQSFLANLPPAKIGIKRRPAA